MYPKVPFHPTPLWEVPSGCLIPAAPHRELSTCLLLVSSLASGPTVLQIISQRQEVVLFMMPRPRGSIRCFSPTVWTLQTALTAEPPLRQHQAMMKSLCDKIRILFPAKEGWRGNPPAHLRRGRDRDRGYHGRLDCPVVWQLGEAGVSLHGRFGCPKETSRHLVWGWWHFNGGNPRF